MRLFGYTSLGDTMRIWFIFICALVISLCQAQKDISTFGDGVKINNNAFQTQQKGSELGDSLSSVRGLSRTANGRTSSQSHANSNEPIPSQHSQPPSPRPSQGGVGSDENAETTQTPDQNSEEVTKIQSQELSSPSPTTGDHSSNQDQDRPQPASKPKLRPPSSGSTQHSGSAAASGSEEAAHTTIGSETASEENGPTSVQPVVNAGTGKGKVSKVHAAKGANVGLKAQQQSSESGAESTPAAVEKGIHLRSKGDTNVGSVAKLENSDTGDGNPNSSDDVKPTHKPRADGHISNGGQVVSDPQTTRAPVGSVPNLSSSQENVPAPADAIQHAASGPQLVPRSKAGPQGPVEKVVKSATPSPPGILQGTGGLTSEENTEDGASGALIKAVNDEYAEVVKNLTDAGVLTEADYESKPVSDLFALLLEKLINANPGANEEDQHRLVHEAGLEFVEILKANAAVTKNVSEIVRLVTEQLQSAQVVLNEGHAESVSPDVAQSSTTQLPKLPAQNRAFGLELSTPKSSSIINHTNLPTQSIIDLSATTIRPVIIGGQSPGQSSGGLFLNGNPIDQTGSSVVPVKPGFGIPNGPKIGNAVINGQIPLNATNHLENASVLQGSSPFDGTISSTESPVQEGPVSIPVGNNRFPFPAHAPSTLRPPLRFFTTTSTTSSVTNSGEIGIDNESPTIHTASPPGSIAFGKGPASSPGVGNRVLIGGNSAQPDLSSIGISDFPTPPTWDFSGSSTLGVPIIGDVNGGLQSGTSRRTTIQPLHPGAFGELLSPLPNSSAGSSIILPLDGGARNGTELPLLPSTTTEINQAPFTHEIQSILGNNSPISTSISPSIWSNNTISQIGSNGTGGSAEVWVVGVTTPQSNVNVTTSRSKVENVTTDSEEAFITDSGDSKEKSKEDISGTSTDASSRKPNIIIPDLLETGNILPNISANGTNQKVDFSLAISTSRDPFDITTPSTSAPLWESGERNISGTGSSTVPVTNASTIGLVIGSDIGSGVGSSSIGTTTSFGIPGSSVGSETVGSTTISPSNGSKTGTPSSAESTTAEEFDIDSNSSDVPNATAEHGSSVGVTLPTHPPLENATAVPSSGEKSTVSSSVPMIVWNFKIVDPQTPWTVELLDKNSFEFKELYGSLIKDLRTIFKTLDAKRFVDVTIKAFSKGSVIVEGQTETTERVDSVQWLESFVKIVEERKNSIGGREVEPNSITFDRRQYAPQSGSANATATAGSGGTPNWIIAVVVAVVLLALVVIAGIVVIKRRKRQNGRDNYMVDEDTMNGGPKAWSHGHRANQQQAQGQQPSRATNGRDQYSGVNMYEMKEPSTQNAHSNYGYQPERAANGHGAHGRSVTEIHINETNLDNSNQAASKH